MQAFFSESIDTTKTRFRRSDMAGGEGAIERVSKRSPYEEGGSGSSGGSRGGKKDKKGGGVLYMLFTVLLLIVIWPVGLIMLWQRRFRLGWAGKLLLTFTTAVVFCFALMFAANIKTENQTVKKVQGWVNDGFDWVYQKTGGTMSSAGEFFAGVFDDAGKKVADIWDQVDESVAERYLDLYAYVEPNIHAVKHDMVVLAAEKYLEIRGESTPAPTAPAIEKQAENKGVQITEPTATPTPTLAPVATPTPTPTPAPTATPAPVTVPEIKNVSEAPVYYTKGGKYYHLTNNCSGMSPAKADQHTLAEALKAGKKTCQNCGVVGADLLDYTGNYLWIDSSNVAHTTDICIEFTTGKYQVLPFEDVYQGHYTYCPVCKGDVCYEYMLQNDSRYHTAYDDLDSETRILYDYEKTITVYYGENSRKYHATTECQMMYDAKYAHTLYEALHVDVKERCGICTPRTEEIAQEEVKAIAAAASAAAEPTATAEASAQQ